MVYLNEADLKNLGIDWVKNIAVIKEAVWCLSKKEFVQPLKPYLRFDNSKNRIIAMPAYIGGNFHVAGIKWIASFPKNIENGVPRAHGIVILNDADTGQSLATINTPLLSIIRTVSVSGLVIQYFDQIKKLKKINIGIIGWGPVGQTHAKMCHELYGNKIENVFIYDIHPIDKNSIDPTLQAKSIVTKNWREAYLNADILITCTVSESRYINEKPKNGALILNISLRDFCANTYQYIKDAIVVDDWDEVCRENTDIEMWSKQVGLKKDDTHSIVDIVCNNYLESIPGEKPVIFNPMGMAIFDIAIAQHFLKMATLRNIGVTLE